MPNAAIRPAEVYVGARFECRRFRLLTSDLFFGELKFHVTLHRGPASSPDCEWEVSEQVLGCLAVNRLVLHKTVAESFRRRESVEVVVAPGQEIVFDDSLAVWPFVA